MPAHEPVSPAVSTPARPPCVACGPAGAGGGLPAGAESRPGLIDVSVCIVNWNSRSLLRDCLRSLVCADQGVTLEAIVADNGSTDGAAEMVAREFPRVVLWRNPANLGFARANNQAARLARGRFLFFLNNDTVVPPGTLRTILDYAEAHPRVGLIGPRLRDGAGRFQVSCRPRPTVATFLSRTSLARAAGILRRGYHRYRRESFDPHTTRPVDVLMGAALFMRRDVFVAHGGWDEGYTFGGEDLDLCLRVGRSRPVVYFPGAEIIHLGRASSRENPGYAAPNIAAGFARYLRRGGASRASLLAYKAVVSADAPLQLLTKAAQYGWRRVRGRRDAARKSLVALRETWSFLSRGLPSFWRA